MAGNRQRPCIRVVVCWAVALLVSLLAAVGIAALAPRMAPVRPGTSESFWKLACGVSLTPDVDGFWGDAYFVDDTWAAYDLSHMHGSDIYCVSVSDVSSKFDAVLDALQQAHARGDDTRFVNGYSNWRDDNEQPRTGPALLKSIKRAGIRELLEEDDVDLAAYSIEEEQRFWRRWQRADWYWANIVFEWTFLSGLVVFALWPGIRNHSALRWAIHVASLPLLFLLPTYLGYATFSFTSAGPSGGILYPFLLMFCRGGSVTAFDSWVLARLPQVLEPLSTPIGSPMALSGMGMPGPTLAIFTGLITGGVVLAVNLGYRRWLKRRS